MSYRSVIHWRDRPIRRFGDVSVLSLKSALVLQPRGPAEGSTMHMGKLVLARLMGHLPPKMTGRRVARCGGNLGVY